MTNGKTKNGERDLGVQEEQTKTMHIVLVNMKQGKIKRREQAVGRIVFAE